MACALVVAASIFVGFCLVASAASLVVPGHGAPRQWIAILAVAAIGSGTAVSWWLWPRFVTRLFRWLHGHAGVALCAVGALLALVATWVSLGISDKQGLLSPLQALYHATKYFSLGNDPPRSPSLLEMVALLLSWAFFFIIAAQAVTLLFADSLKTLRLRSLSGHVVICGAGRIGRQLVASLGDTSSVRIVVIERDPDNPNLSWLREQGVLVLVQAAQRRDGLHKARAAHAKEVFVCTGSDDVNLECVAALREEVAEAGVAGPRCRIHLRDADLATAMRWTDGARGAERRLPIDVFNTTERATQLLLQVLADDGALPMGDTEVGHVVIIGFGEFGRSLALSLAEVGHFPNVARLRMTIADRDIAPTARRFLARYPRFTRRHGDAVPLWDGSPSLPEPLDGPRAAADEWAPGGGPGLGHVCNAVFVDLADVADERWVAALDAALRQETVKPVVFVAFDQDGANFTAAHRLAAVRDRLGAAAGRWPIYYWVPLPRHFEGDSTSATAGAAPPIAFGNCLDSAAYAVVTNHWSDRLAKVFKMVYAAAYPPDGKPPRGADVTAEARAGLIQLRKCCTGAAPTGAWSEVESKADSIWEAERRELRRAIDRSAAVHAVIKLAACGVGLARGDQPAAPSGKPDAEVAAILGRLRRAAVREIPTPRVDGVTGFDTAPFGDHGAGGDAATADDRRLLGKLVRMEHYRWCAERLLAGWEYARQPGNDDEEKELWRMCRHWDLRVFEQLDRGEQVKNHLPVHLLLALAFHGRLTSLRSLGGRQASDAPAREA